MWVPAKTKVARKQQIKDLLLTNDTAVQRGVVAIYKRQTEDEKATLATREHNGIGYSGVHAEIMSSFAQRLMRGNLLSEKQLACARKIIVHYAGQLMEIADSRTGTPA